tara:strand:- start:1127 stop:1321 length:195 start_codon:yes stop_codon:yes gene_type:complete
MDKFNYVVAIKGHNKGEFHDSMRSVADSIKVNHSTISKKLANDIKRCAVVSKQLKEEFYIYKLG